MKPEASSLKPRAGTYFTVILTALDGIPFATTTSELADLFRTARRTPAGS